MRLAALLVLVSVSAIGCRSTAEGEFGDHRQPYRTLRLAKFRALDFGNHVILYATGFNSTTGQKNGLTRESSRDGIPQFRLYGELRPGQCVGMAMTPFIVSEVLPPLDRKTLRVRDARGVYDVPIEPAEAVSYLEWQQLAYPR